MHAWLGGGGTRAGGGSCQLFHGTHRGGTHARASDDSSRKGRERGGKNELWWRKRPAVGFSCFAAPLAPARAAHRRREQACRFTRRPLYLRLSSSGSATASVVVVRAGSSVKIHESSGGHALAAYTMPVSARCGHGWRRPGDADTSHVRKDLLKLLPLPVLTREVCSRCP